MIERILFQGGGWAAIGELGVIAAIEEELRRPNSKVAPDVKLYGFSAGAFTLLAFACGITKEDQLKHYAAMSDAQLEVIATEFTLDPTRTIFESFKRVFTRFPDAYKRMNEKRCRIGVSTPDGFTFYKNFASNEQLAEIVLASFHIPIYCRYNSEIDGRACMDGAILYDRNKFVEGDANSALIVRSCFEEEEGASHIHLDVPPIFIVSPIPVLLRDYYYERGYDRAKHYFESPVDVKAATGAPFLLRFADLAWWLRRNQTTDVERADLLAYLEANTT